MPDSQSHSSKGLPIGMADFKLRRQRLLIDETRQARELNKLILASSRDCIVVLDVDGCTEFISPGGIAALEISDIDSVVGTSWLEGWQGRDWEAARHAMDFARNGGIGRFEGACATETGTQKWWDVVISPLPGADDTRLRLVAVARDITSRVLAQERQVVSEETLRLAFEAAEVSTWEIDGRTKLITLADRGHTVGQVLPKSYCLADFYARIHPEDRARIIDALEATFEPSLRASLDIEYRTIGHADGRIRWISDRGRGFFDAHDRCIRVSGTVMDITARRAAEESLRGSEAALRELNATLEARVEQQTRERDRAWNNSRDLLMVIDEAGSFHAANDAWATILGRQPAEMVGTHFRDLIHPEEREAADIAFAGVQGLPAHEGRYRHKDGSYCWISWVFTTEEGLIYGNGRHISAEKAAAAEFEDMQEKLRQSQKMEAVGQLTGGLAHDFNNLLASISGSLELLGARLAKGQSDDFERYLDAAQGAATRAASLTHRLLAFSRRQTLDPRPTDANRLVAGMEELIGRTAGPQIAVAVELADLPCPTLVDANQLENALLNLCINARHAMPGGGRLTIRTLHCALDAQSARAGDVPAGNYVLLEVSDTGSGMAPEVVARAFDPFFTTKPIGTGTGLGLSMVYGFVRQSGGMVAIDSAPSAGTTVHVYLPCHFGEADGLERAGNPGQTPQLASGETVLLVDDEPTLRMLIAEVLEESGYRVIEAGDGAGGMKVLQSNVGIDLLITDVGLPGGMNGRQLADAARQIRTGLPVLFITGFSDSAAVGGGDLEAGMQVLTKPFPMATLARRTEALIASKDSLLF